MLNESNFTPGNIERLRTETGRGPSLLERMVFAFGLLEALVRTGLDFTFKGGTSMMILLERPRRISTDIDIIVKPGTDIDAFIEKASKIFPFTGYEEQVRRIVRNIEKRHFKFFYTSSVSGKGLHIILDVLFEKSNYPHTVRKEIACPLIITGPPAIYVNVPTANCIMGDKLTAFAPHTIGIPFDADKEMEIIKQLYDVATLIEKCDNFTDVKRTYRRVAKTEIEYRRSDADIADTLSDSFNAVISIISKGKQFSEDYKKLLDGIRRVRGHIFGSYSVIDAEGQSCRVAYLIASILADSTDLPLIADVNPYLNRMITDPNYRRLNYVKKISLENFAYLYEAIRLFTSS